MKCVWLTALEIVFGIYCSVCLKEPIIFYFILFVASVSLIPEYIMYTQVDDIKKKKKKEREKKTRKWLYGLSMKFLVGALLPSN